MNGYAPEYVKKDEKPALLFLHRWNSQAKKLCENFKKVAGDNIELKEITFEKKGSGIDTLAWAYINFLQVGDKILLPSFGLADEKSVIEQFDRHFGNKLRTIEMSKIARQGGALHCLTWNIRIDKEKYWD